MRTRDEYLEVMTEYHDNAYYIQIALDYHGAAVRDNSQAELIAIGKAIDSGEVNE